MLDALTRPVIRDSHNHIRAENVKATGENLLLFSSWQTPLAADLFGWSTLNYPKTDEQEYIVEFDFLGKDSIHYYNKDSCEEEGETEHV